MKFVGKLFPVCPPAVPPRFIVPATVSVPPEPVLLQVYVLRSKKSPDVIFRSPATDVFTAKIVEVELLTVRLFLHYPLCAALNSLYAKYLFMAMAARGMDGNTGKPSSTNFSCVSAASRAALAVTQ